MGVGVLVRLTCSNQLVVRTWPVVQRYPTNPLNEDKECRSDVVLVYYFINDPTVFFFSIDVNSI